MGYGFRQDRGFQQRLSAADSPESMKITLKTGRHPSSESSGPLDERDDDDEDMLFWSPFGPASSTGEWDLEDG